MPLLPFLQAPVSTETFVWNSQWVPDFVFTQSYEFDTLITQGKLGPEKRRGVRAYSIGTFSLNFSAITKAQAASMYTFFVDSKGPFRPFEWTNPVDGFTYTVRFMDNTFSQQEVGYDLMDIQIKFRHLF